MELREYYKILRSNISIVVYTLIIAVLAAYAWSMKISQLYSTSLTLNISRTETQATNDYRYDQFYRLEADEKFAETIVQWLKTPGVAKDIFDKAGVSATQKTMRDLSKSFRAEKLSSNLISLEYSTETSEEASRIAPAIASVISEKTISLNQGSRDPNWFETSSSNLIILKNTPNLSLNLAVAAVIGFFVGVFLAFGKHYISK